VQVSAVLTREDLAVGAEAAELEGDCDCQILPYDSEFSCFSTLVQVSAVLTRDDLAVRAKAAELAGRCDFAGLVF